MQKIKNKIIVEGFWNMGKSTLIQNLNEKKEYLIIKEPDHIKSCVPGNINIDQWYINQHLYNQKRFFRDDKEKIITERSILDGGAFAYIKNKKKREIERLLLNFLKNYKKTKPLVVFLTASTAVIRKRSTRIRSRDVNDEKIKKLLKKDDFIIKYEKFFREVLPFWYGITPLFINIGYKKLKSQEQIKNNVILALKNDRIAQINIVCYKFTLKGNPLFLILKRNKKKGGFWQTLSGGIKSSQTIEEAIKMEIKEELNLKIKKESLLQTNYTFHYIGTKGYELNEYVFGYKLDNSDKIRLSKEHTEYRFVGLNEAIRLVKYQNNKILLKKVYNIIKERATG